jgi:hypothetical protein
MFQVLPISVNYTKIPSTKTKIAIVAAIIQAIDNMKIHEE